MIMIFFFFKQRLSLLGHIVHIIIIIINDYDL